MLTLNYYVTCGVDRLGIAMGVCAYLLRKKEEGEKGGAKPELDKT